MYFDLTTRASPDQALRALTDFSDRRLQTWHRTLDPARYEVRGLGDTWALAREATPGSPFWIVSRYDWSDPTVVRWAHEETSYGGHGTGEVRIAPTDDGGSRLHVEWSNTGATRRRDRVMLALVHNGPVHRLIARLWARALDDYARSEAG